MDWAKAEGERGDGRQANSMNATNENKATCVILLKGFSGRGEPITQTEVRPAEWYFM
jgi:hypothetical protein